LHAWLGDGDSSGGQGHASFRPTAEPSRAVFDEMMSTGAVVVGRRTIEQAGYWGGEHHDGVPVFIPTHRAPDADPPGQLRYVTDGIESCVEQAKAAAGERDVLLHGAVTAQECLRARLLDVLEIQLIPVLLGQGRPLFGGLITEPIELNLVRTLQAPEALHLRYEIRYP
jgi:dihydrofolate reductase